MGHVSFKRDKRIKAQAEISNKRLDQNSPEKWLENKILLKNENNIIEGGSCLIKDIFLLSQDLKMISLPAFLFLITQSHTDQLNYLKGAVLGFPFLFLWGKHFSTKKLALPLIADCVYPFLLYAPLLPIFANVQLHGALIDNNDPHPNYCSNH